MIKKFHIVPYSFSNDSDIMGNDIEDDKRIDYTYLHGALEEKAVKFGGYDIYGFVGEKPKEKQGIYKGFVEFPDEKIECTIFFWLDKSEGGHGLVVANNDTESFKDAEKKFSTKKSFI